MNLLAEFNDFVASQAMRASPNVFQNPANQFLVVLVVDVTLLLLFIWGARASLRSVADKKKQILLFGVIASALADILLIPIMLGEGRKIDAVGIGLICFLNAFLVGLAALPYFFKTGLASANRNLGDKSETGSQMVICPGCKGNTISMQGVRHMEQTCRSCGRSYRLFLPKSLMTGGVILFLIILFAVIYLFLQGTISQIMARNIFFGICALYLVFMIYGGRLVEIEKDKG